MKMINNLQFLQNARILLMELMNERIIEEELNVSHSQLKLFLDSGEIILIRYNQYGEYGYQIIHSRQKRDFSRFDNFDDKWDVKSRPHHYHLRGGKNVKSSPMTGNPKDDMPILVNYIE